MEGEEPFDDLSALLDEMLAEGGSRTRCRWADCQLGVPAANGGQTRHYRIVKPDAKISGRLDAAVPLIQS